MPKSLRLFVRWIDATNRGIGHAVMHGFFLMMPYCFGRRFPRPSSTLRFGPLKEIARRTKAKVVQILKDSATMDRAGRSYRYGS